MNHPIVQVYPTLIIYRASAIGGCPRALYAARMGYEPKPPPPDMQVIFDRGHEIENITKQILRNAGVTIVRDQEEVTLEIGTINGRRVVVVGHIDCVDNLDNGILEIKGFSRRLLDQFVSNGITSMPRYSWQISSYCYGMGITHGRFIIYDKDSDSDELDPDRLVVYSFGSPPVDLEEIKRRVIEIEQYASAAIQPNCQTDYPCPYYYLHDVKSKGELTTTAENMLIAYAKLRDSIKQFELAKDKLADRIKEKIPHDDDNKSFANPLGTVRVSFIKNSSRLDQKKAKQILVDAGVDESEFMVEGVGEYLRVTIGGKDNE